MNNKFHERFGIHVDAEDTKARFVTRIRNRVFYTFCLNSGLDYWDLLPPVADRLGIEYDSRITSDAPIADYTGKDFHKTLQAVEALYETVPGVKKDELTQLIRTTLADAELDLGIRWEDGTFLPSGAKLLDQDLIDESLHWLMESGYDSVTAPFSKGLDHFVHAEKRPELLADVVTDMYEALEALAKIETGRDKDLSANAEAFVKTVKASEPYKVILKQYIEYANNFRHATGKSASKPNLSAREVESFMYLTGLFIRLAIK